jgi:acyl-CoA thioesterase-1
MNPLKSIRAVALTLNMVMILIIWGCGNSDSSSSTSNPTIERKNNSISNSEKKEILFFGNSLTAGYGLSEQDAFPNLIQNIIDSLKLPYKVINAGNSGETTAGGKNRIGWVLTKNTSIFVLELGANDGLRKIEVASSKQNLQSIIDSVRKFDDQIKIVLAGMKVPPNLGIEYGKEFEKMYHELAIDNNIALIPFLLEDVAGNKELNQADGIHPTAEGQRIVAKNVWAILKSEIPELTK